MESDWRGHKIAIREAGAGPGLLLVHGYPLDGAMWSAVARRLSERFRVLKPDLPGHGDNPAEPDGAIGTYTDFLQSIVQTVGSPVGLAGFSMGGYVALEFMTRRPSFIGALALVDTRAAADTEEGKGKRNEAISTLRTQGVGVVADAMLPRLLSPASLAKAELVERVRRIILRQSPTAIESDLTAMRDRRDSTGFLPELSVPTLVVAGEHDAISPVPEGQAMATAIPAGRFVEIPEAGHLTPMESPAAVAQALGDFFSETLVP